MHKWPLWLCVGSAHQDSAQGSAHQDSAQGERTRTGRAWRPHLFCMALFTSNLLWKHEEKNNKTEFILHKWPLWLCVVGARQDSAQGERTRTERAWRPYLSCMALFTHNFSKKKQKNQKNWIQFYSNNNLDLVSEARAETARMVSAQELGAREGSIFFVWPCLHPIYSKNIKKQ